MCGIFGIISDKNVTARIFSALVKLEYRGYDSSGISVVSDNDGSDSSNQFSTIKAAGKISSLKAKFNCRKLSGKVGIGHTRWATHGAAIDMNAHPFQGDRFCLIHNGIIENFASLKEEVKSYQFTSQTDSEVVLALLEKEIAKNDNELDISKAISKVCLKLKGTFAIVLIDRLDTNKIWFIKLGSPLMLGFGDNQAIVCSDTSALEVGFNKVVFLEDGDYGYISKEGDKIYNKHGSVCNRAAVDFEASNTIYTKGRYKHYMQKEIYEQPIAIANTIEGLLNPLREDVAFDYEAIFFGIERIHLVACGTAYHAASVASLWFESLAKVAVDFHIASEFRYRDVILDKKSLVIFISQSGETMDTLQSLKKCLKNNIRTIAIINSKNSSIARLANYKILTLAGTEIGVASTKAFTTQLVVLYLLTLKFAQMRKLVSNTSFSKALKSLCILPTIVSSQLLDKKLDKQIKESAKKISSYKLRIYIGRGKLFPIALEGALKLKEITYLATEGYAAGELKHGALALVNSDCISVVVAPTNRLFSKTLSNTIEIVSRGGLVIFISDSEGLKKLGDIDGIIAKISIHEYQENLVDLQPILAVIPLQLLAYQTGVILGTDIDQPRNLAKSVTVE